MQSDDDRSTPRLPNIFLREFLDLLGRHDEPPAAVEAAVAGPWHIEEVHATFYAVYRSGESVARGHRPLAVFTDPTHALLIAALLPATGRDPLYRLATWPSLTKLVDALHVVECLLRSPEALANLLEAAGSVVLERGRCWWGGWIRSR